jgi:hypothetical protein
MSQLKKIEAKLELENDILETQIAQKESLQFIEQHATHLGFSSNKTVDYIKPANIASIQ